MSTDPEAVRVRLRAVASRADDAAPIRLRTLAFLLGLVVVAAAVVDDGALLAEYVPGLAGWSPAAIDWLFLPALLAFGCYVVVPALARPARTGHLLRALSSNVPATLALGYLVVFFLVGTLGPTILGEAHVGLDRQYQPPLFVTVDATTLGGDCLAASPVERCSGTLAHPVGTDKLGRDVLLTTVAGMQVALQVSLVAATIIVPIAVAVGTVSGLFGGRVDSALMRYVDVQQTVPALLVFFILSFLYGRGLVLFVVVFGLLNWGGVARVVRSEVRRRRNEPFVEAAEGFGAGRVSILRRHLLPAVSGTVVTALSQQVPLFILTEAAISFMELNGGDRASWGETIVNGLRSFPDAWWISTVPVVALCLTVVSMVVLGDALRDIFDVRI